MKVNGPASRGARGPPILLLFSARSWDDALFRDELFARDRAHNAFTLVLALTRAAVRRGGDYGRRIDTAMIFSGVYFFANNPDQWDLVRDDPSLIPAAINAILRMEAPIQGFSRYRGA
jgi:hypothetical protein